MYDSKYDSRMHDITIPLMGFNGFHHASNYESKDDFEDFIGRESILDKLYSWLEDHEKNKEKKYSGAYLITGFRGMGKSSFVYKAIIDIKKKAKNHPLKDKYYVPISINIGNDLLSSKELLYIICKLLTSAFAEKTRLKHNAWSRVNLMVPQLLTIVFCIWLFFGNDIVFTKIYDFFTTNLFALLSSLKADGIKTLLIKIYESSDLWTNFFKVLTFLISTTGFCYIWRYVYYLLWKLTDCDLFITNWQIKRVFSYLNQRIDTEMTVKTENRVDVSAGVGDGDISDFLLKNTYRRRKIKKQVYPIAQTSEIQDLLVNQLRLIKRLPMAKFRFIFIIDELDKVSPEDNEKQIIPEYEYTNAVSGNSSYRSRQMALSGLLSNMKYFISSSEAKFVFITGYDMYEATLSDISNREFNLHSIFNGYINVSSFLRKTGTNKGADSMIEKYFCHLLLRPQDVVDGKREDLHDYAHFFRSEWEKNDTENDKEHLEMQLDRRILFLRQFLTYLFYMSNGSPKKLAVYLEKYVRSKDRVIHQYEKKYKDNIKQEFDDISLGVKSYWEDCKWFLFFDIRNIQKIGFIHYLIYPMLKNLIAKSSTYSDKLLVSTSFMISNLYKFHKSGFSWRNLEYMPELLDINKVPELRDFIGGILQFLNQTHIDEAVGNLYKFKFPQRLSEEITFFSKTAEEVSYLFNFSHDELLSIKTLYNKQLDHYNIEKYESPAIASLHHLLGDIYMLEENYEQAIYEFNEALFAIDRQENNVNKIFKASESASNILFKIRVTLKLGLAYEKRKTFDTAYITYDNLVKYVLNLASTAKPFTLSEEAQTPSQIVTRLKSNSKFFTNIKIAYLGILAKVAVIEKMDLGGIQELDLWRQIKEFSYILNQVNGSVRPVALIDFFTKLGCILYYKNSRNSDGFIRRFRQEIGSIGSVGLFDKQDDDKFYSCVDSPVTYQSIHSESKKSLLTPCMACQYFNLSIKKCIEQLNGNVDDYEKNSKALFFINKFFNVDASLEIYKEGNQFIMAMSNALLGMGNTLFSCSKVKSVDLSGFFDILGQICRDSKIDEDRERKMERWLSPFTKSILYYLAAAEGYKMLTDFKASYNIYIQILSAVNIYYHVVDRKNVPKATLSFCHVITRRAIACAYLHYDSINCTEVNTQKYEMSKNYTEIVNLHSLTVFPEIEVAVDRYYRICLKGDKSERNEVLKKVLNARQMTCYKLTSTLTQNIQNLCLKLAINKEILSRIIPKLTDQLELLETTIDQVIPVISDYFLYDDCYEAIDELFGTLGWNLLKKDMSLKEKKFVLLDYLVKDSLFCLNTITELIEPLYSTTLYNDSFIGEIYKKAFCWNLVLICLREIYEYADDNSTVGNKDGFIENMNNRYKFSAQMKSGEFDDTFKELYKYLNSLESWKSYCSSDISKVESIYQKINPSSGNLLVSSYLAGMAVDRYSKAIEMHTSGKAYKEMMATLFFLEDDLQNDSNYMNLAIERFLINHGVIQKRMNQLQKYTLKVSSLLVVDNYVKQ